jgi:hypothetical protein
MSLDLFRELGIKPTLKELISLTEVLSEYAETGYTPSVKSRLEPVQEYLNERVNTNQALKTYPIKGSVEFKGE